ncbi:MAG: Mpv17/PMP22 family protein [Verrucomicrobiales bacterium]|jgi:hypothetical protein|nr:Mpv17/PMP22 family protein [Verrucomicrobiales bacterium]
MKPILTPVTAAVRANLRPGVVLWLALLAFVLAWLFSAGFRGALQWVADAKQGAEYRFAFGVYVLFAAVLPELLQIVFFQQGRPRWQNGLNCGFGVWFWGIQGVATQGFYDLLALCFGTGADPLTVTVKTAVNMGLYCPAGTAAALIVFKWREHGYALSAWRPLTTATFWLTQYLPLQVSGWMLWIPVSFVVFFLPLALQLPVTALIFCFWVLIFTFVGRRDEPGKP